MMRRELRLYACALIAFAVTMAIGWIVYLPIFLHPDEDSHYDYALTLASVGRLMRGDENVVGRDTHPTVEFLMRETHAREQRLDVHLPAAPGYGSRAYYEHLDRHAPENPVEQTISPAPYISRLYPFGYYAVAALAIRTSDVVFHHSAIAEFFSVRVLSTMLLVPTLWFGFLSLCELGLNRRRIRVIFACFALMPLTAWTAASVQPDVLAAALIAPSTYLALRLRKAPTRTSSLVLLGLLFGALIATKQHYFAAIFVPILAMLVFRLPFRSAARRSVLAIVLVTFPAIISLAVTTHFMHASREVVGICHTDPHYNGATLAAASGLSGAVLGFRKAVRETFFDDAALSFWVNYTAYRNTPLDVVSEPVTHVLSIVIPGLTMTIGILFILRFYQNARRLLFLAYRHSWIRAARIATSNVLVNSYLTFIVIVYAFVMWTAGAVPLQGRYWLPFLPAIWYVAFVVAPRALPHRFARIVEASASAFVIVFVIVAGAYTFPSLHERFYEVSRVVDPREEVETNVGIRPSGDSVEIVGTAYDLRNATPVERISLRVDDRTLVAPQRFDRPDIQCDMEKTLLHVGFATRIPFTTLRPGRHTVKVLVSTPWHLGLIETKASAIFEVPTRAANVIGEKHRSIE